jgi:hypothetical protein
MEQDNPNTSGFGTTSATERPGTSIGSTTKTDSETCAHCGQSVNQNAGLEQFLGRIGISDEMIDNLKTQMQNVDIEEYLNTARDYLRTAGDKVKDGSEKATRYAKDNPGKLAAGVAVLAVGAGLLINSLRDRD